MKRQACHAFPVIALLLFAGAAQAQDATLPGDTCAGGNITAGMQQPNNNAIYRCTTTGATRNWYPEPLYLGASSATCDASHQGLQRYNSTSTAMEYCNGTAWTPLYQVQTTPAITAPAGSGYFVLTATTWNGNLGGLAGADAKCLTELGTTYTSWRGYSTANSNGQIIASKVKSFLCGTTCNNLMPLTTYYFARADSGTPGGASFTTDASGLGPGNANAWSAANYFSGTYSWWSGRIVSGSNFCSTAYNSGGAFYTACSSNWASSSSGITATYGATANTDTKRWFESTSTCDLSLYLICFVNP